MPLLRPWGVPASRSRRGKKLFPSRPPRGDSRRFASRGDLAYFELTGRPQREKGVKFNLKNAEQRLDSAREELKQLEKMYKTDDLTEETEGIILKRQRRAVESAEVSLDNTRLSVERDLTKSIPREGETLSAGQADQRLSLTAELSISTGRALRRKRSF